MGVIDIFGRQIRLDSDLTKQRLADAGFVDIKEEVIRLPLSGWPAKALGRDLGRWFNLGVQRACQPLSLAPLIRGHGWTPDEIPGVRLPVGELVAIDGGRPRGRVGLEAEDVPEDIGFPKGAVKEVVHWLERLRCRGQYRTLLDSASDATVAGCAYLVPSAEAAHRLAYYVRDQRLHPGDVHHTPWRGAEGAAASEDVQVCQEGVVRPDALGKADGPAIAAEEQVGTRS